jgi:hypothetical protein
MASTNKTTAAIVNRRILDFVSDPNNLRLKPGTGAYSTLFRGSLFGLTDDLAVTKRLKQRRVDVLWLGANPCVPKSLDYITSPPAHDGDFPAFVQQLDSGLFSSTRWDESGDPLPDFSPLERPKGNWQVYRDVLLRFVGSLDGVTMANVIPWGSGDVEAFLDGVGAVDQGLLRRALRFADDLNVMIVSMLRPRLLIVPLSIGRNRQMDALHSSELSLAKADNAEQHRIPLGARSFKFTTATCRRGDVTVPVAYLPHPVALRVPRNSKDIFVKHLAKIIGAVRWLSLQFAADVFLRNVTDTSFSMIARSAESTRPTGLLARHAPRPSKRSRGACRVPLAGSCTAQSARSSQAHAAHARAPEDRRSSSGTPRPTTN